jgi:hypothetical protein
VGVNLSTAPAIDGVDATNGSTNGPASPPTVTLRLSAQAIQPASSISSMPPPSSDPAPAPPSNTLNTTSTLPSTPPPSTPLTSHDQAGPSSDATSELELYRQRSAESASNSQTAFSESAISSTGQRRRRPGRRTPRSRAHADARTRRSNADCLTRHVPMRAWIILGFRFELLRMLLRIRRRLEHRASELLRITMEHHPLCLTFITKLRTRVSSRRLAMRLLRLPPKPLHRDVGWNPDSRSISFRDACGITSDRHPNAGAVAAGSVIPAYAPDGSIVPPLSPPPDSPVVLCPESTGAWCYYDTVNGTASWHPPPESTPLELNVFKYHAHAQGEQCMFMSELPPLSRYRLNSLAYSGWRPIYRDAVHEMLLVSETGAVRAAPWINLRSPDGVIYYANLQTGQTRWFPPHLWMEGWISRPPADAERMHDLHRYGSTHLGQDLADISSYIHACSRPGASPCDPRSPLPPLIARMSVQGGAPYLHEHGKPQYEPDQYDSPRTYPVEGNYVGESVRRTEQPGDPSGTNSRITLWTAVPPPARILFQPEEPVMPCFKSMPSMSTTVTPDSPSSPVTPCFKSMPSMSTTVIPDSPSPPSPPMSPCRTFLPCCGPPDERAACMLQRAWKWYTGDLTHGAWQWYNGDMTPLRFMLPHRRAYSRWRRLAVRMTRIRAAPRRALHALCGPPVQRASCMIQRAWRRYVYVIVRYRWHATIVMSDGTVNPVSRTQTRPPVALYGDFAASFDTSTITSMRNSPLEHLTGRPRPHRFLLRLHSAPSTPSTTTPDLSRMAARALAPCCGSPTYRASCMIQRAWRSYVYALLWLQVSTRCPEGSDQRRYLLKACLATVSRGAFAASLDTSLPWSTPSTRLLPQRFLLRSPTASMTPPSAECLAACLVQRSWRSRAELSAIDSTPSSPPRASAARNGSPQHGVLL